MFKIKYIFAFSCLVLGTNIQAQSKAIRSHLQKQYTTSESSQLTDELEIARKARQRDLKLYQRENIEFKSEFTDEVNYFQAQRVEGNTVIYYKTLNEVARNIHGVDQLVQAADPALNQLMGQDMVVGVIDGDMAFVKHIEFAQGAQSKIKVMEDWEENSNEGSPTFLTLERRRNHATHVVGTILAQGVNRAAMGMAPLAEAFSIKWTDDMAKMNYLAQQGILVTNHSYGIAAVDDNKKPLLPPEYFGAYTIDASNMDRIAYMYPYLQPVVAAGNDRDKANLINPTKQGMDLLLGHANAKNAIVVGAIGLGRNGSLRETAFSSNGPTNDFRIKPDIVAIGEDVLSSAYQYRFSDGSIEKNNLYARLSGTSMAAPTVSGILLLWQQWAILNHSFPYRAATIKGVMVNSAEDMPYQIGPNARTGWGMINAWNGIQLLNAAKNKKAVIEESVLRDKQIQTFQISLTEKVNRLSFTLSWTDVEGKYEKLNFVESTGIKHLVNDLDIRVYKEGQVYLPWRLIENYNNEAAVKGDNVVDNLERIDISQPELGSYEVVVSHKGTLTNKIQDFSLLVNSDTYTGVQPQFENVEASDAKLIAWPNPVEDVLHLEIPSNFVFSSFHAVIHNSVGKQILEIPIAASNRQSLNLSFLSSGMYYFQIKNADVKYQIKFIKK